MKYRKKPVVIDAWEIADTRSRDIPAWVLQALNQGTIRFNTEGPGLVIGTLEGEMRGALGDMLIKGVAGELYPCAKPIFQATYERVPE
jgi:hypothetical protein